MDSWNEEGCVGFAKFEFSGLGNFRTAPFQQPGPPAFQILGKCLHDTQAWHTSTTASLKIGSGVENLRPVSQ